KRGTAVPQGIRAPTVAVTRNPRRTWGAPIALACPTGKSLRLIRIDVKPLREKYSCSVFQNNMLVSAYPESTEGRIAIVTNVGHGMRWTPGQRMTSVARADGEIVWS